MNHRKSIQCATLLALLGCGDDDGDHRDGEQASKSVSDSCAAICGRMERAACNVDLTRCNALCEQQYALSSASCRNLADQLLDCASKATFSCGADGPVATFCAPIVAALDGCAGGAPPAPMDASMQPDSNAPSPAPDTGDAGVTTDSEDASVSDGSSGSGDDASGTPLVDAGQGDDGGGLLSCEPGPDDEPCDSCLKSQCCEQVTACGDDCVALIECGDICPTQACVDDCLALHPTGAAELERFWECAAESCSSVCDDGAL